MVLHDHCTGTVEALRGTLEVMDGTILDRATLQTRQEEVARISRAKRHAI